MSTAFRTGLFVFVALLFLSLGIFLIGNRDFLFARTYRLEANFANVEGLDNGADVRVGGIHEGTVKEIDLPAQPDGQMAVVMNLRSSTKQIIKKDSVASLQTEGLLGDKFVEISFGSTKADAVRNGDTIRGEQPKDMGQQVEAVASEAQAATSAARDDLQALQHNFLLRGYFASRGYNDASELTAHAIARLPAEASLKEFHYETKKLFANPTGAELKNKKALDEPGNYLAENPFGLAVVESSEVLGDSQKDKTLSEARAKAVRDYLAQNFRLDDTRLKTIGLGKTKDADASKITIFVYAAKPSGTASAQNAAVASNP